MSSLDLLIILGIPAVVILVPVYLGFHARMALMQLVRDAAEAGNPVSAETIHALRTAPPKSFNRDLRRGALLLAIGIALLLMGVTAFVMMAGSEAAAGTGVVLSGLGIIPSCLGAAFLFLGWAERRLVKD